jgi:hypothetical protein
MWFALAPTARRLPTKERPETYAASDAFRVIRTGSLKDQRTYGDRVFASSLDPRSTAARRQKAIHEAKDVNAFRRVCEVQSGAGFQGREGAEERPKLALSQHPTSDITI